MGDRIKVGTRVEVIGKGVFGQVAYIGTTLFSTGKWVGVVLDEAKGKNNGTVQGKTYFQSPENHGIFVRQSQIQAVDSPEGGSDTATTPTDVKKTARRSGLRPPSFVGKSSENIAEAASRSSSKETSPSTSMEMSSSFSEPSRMQTSMTTSRESSGIPSRMSRSRETTPSEEKSLSITSPSTRTVSQAAAADVTAMRTIAEDKFSVLQKEQENAGLKAEIKDLNEKLETLKVKRIEDKAKLKEFEKLKIEMQIISENKVKMKEVNNDLNRKLQAAEKEARDVRSEYDRYKEEMADFAETVEIATLDKEMAEEKCEGLEQELESLKEKYEELILDHDILENEIKDKGTEGVAANYECKQVELQNERLKEALVKMRDLSNEEKHENQRLGKQNEKLQSEVVGLRKDKEKQLNEILELQNQTIELKEQLSEVLAKVDAALGAEEMLTTLTEKNLKLEEVIEQMEEEKADLETLHEMNEELQENARETELELREELDLTNARLLESKRKIEAAWESMADYDQTISKFRDLVSQLQDDNKELRSKQAEAEQKQDTPPLEVFDFKTKFAESKAYAKTIDMELRKLDVAQANVHVSLLQSFMPDTFLKTGDSDAILAVLLVPRAISKAELLISHVRDKFDVTDTIIRDDVFKTHRGAQVSYANSLIMLLNILIGVLHQFESALKTCSVELLLKISTLVPEMAIHEKALDYFIDMLRKDQLDETVSMDFLEKSLNYFQQLYSVHLVNEKVNCTHLMADQVKLALSSCDSIQVDITRLKMLLQPGEEKSEFSILLRDLETCNNDTRMCAKKIRRRLPQNDGSSTASPLMCPKEIQNILLDCGINIVRVSKSLHHVALGAMVQEAVLSSSRQQSKSDDNEGVKPKQMEELAYEATDKVYGKEDSGPYECLRLSFGAVVGTMNKVANAMENGEYDFDGTHDKQIQAPIAERANIVKSRIADIETLKIKLDKKEEDIKDLKMQLKLKQETLSQQQLKVKVTEKKLETATKEYEDESKKLKQQLDEVRSQLEEQQKQFEKNVRMMQEDIDHLQEDRTELEKKFKSATRKHLMEGLSRNNSAGPPPASPTVTCTSSTNVQESPMLKQQISSMKEALNHVIQENIRLKGQRLRDQMSQLPSLYVPKKPTGLANKTGLVKIGELPDNIPGKTELNDLTKRVTQLLKEANQLSACPVVIDISSRKPGSKPVTQTASPNMQLIRQSSKLVQLEKGTQELQVQVTNFLAANRTGGQVRTDFSSFPTPEYARVLKEKSLDSLVLGRISIPTPGTRPEVIPVNIQPSQLHTIHNKLITVNP
ncbi:dynactin subunit 1 isoform X3 [Octopus sinensis]|uniref:Dynactin subunit 1 n=1 Tax=Octopus sinensis TaxID=2607531 RepID=A0A6P7T3G0_9MOLL|nr:dynactin subunit 1 isoform X3 [Octopus sinensis]